MDKKEEINWLEGWVKDIEENQYAASNPFKNTPDTSKRLLNILIGLLDEKEKD